MDVGYLDLAGMKQQSRLAVELVEERLVHGNILLGPNTARPVTTMEMKKKKPNKTKHSIEIEMTDGIDTHKAQNDSHMNDLLSIQTAI